MKQAERAEKLGRCLLPGRCLNERQSVELINDQQFHNLDYRHLTSASSVRHIKLLASLKCPLTLYIQVVTLSTTSLTFNNSTFCPNSCIHVFRVDLRTNSKYLHLTTFLYALSLTVTLTILYTRPLKHCFM